jgi:Ca2+-binding EF-hand superfamily protein
MNAALEMRELEQLRDAVAEALGFDLEMQNNPENTGKAMDYNKDGRIDRYEFVRYQGRMFDKMAGTKGYATYADVSKMMKDFGSVFPLDNSKD